MKQKRTVTGDFDGEEITRPMTGEEMREEKQTEQSTEQEILETIEKLEKQLWSHGLIFSKLSLGGILGIVEMESEYKLSKFKEILLKDHVDNSHNS